MKPPFRCNKIAIRNTSGSHACLNLCCYCKVRDHCKKLMWGGSQGGIAAQCKMVSKENPLRYESAVTLLPPDNLMWAWTSHLSLVCVSFLICKLREVGSNYLSHLQFEHTSTLCEASRSWAHTSVNSLYHVTFKKKHLWFDNTNYHSLFL